MAGGGRSVSSTLGSGGNRRRSPRDRVEHRLVGVDADGAAQVLEHLSNLDAGDDPILTKITLSESVGAAGLEPATSAL